MRGKLRLLSVFLGVVIVWTARLACDNYTSGRWWMLAVNLGWTIPCCSAAIWLNGRTLSRLR